MKIASNYGMTFDGNFWGGLIWTDESTYNYNGYHGMHFNVYNSSFFQVLPSVELEVRAFNKL